MVFYIGLSRTHFSVHYSISMLKSPGLLLRSNYVYQVPLSDFELPATQPVLNVQLQPFNQFYCCFPEKYDYVGRLLKPGDEPSEYTDEEDIKDHLKND